MKKFFVFTLCFVVLLGAGSLSAKSKKKPGETPAAAQKNDGGSIPFVTDIANGGAVWPALTKGYVYYAPSDIRSEDEAISNIRSSQGFIRIRGEKPYDIAVDRYSAVFKIQWTENQTFQENVPTSGGFFIGWDYIPTFSNTVQTYHQTKQMNDALAVQFKDIVAIYFFQNNLCLRDSGGGISYLASDNAAGLRTLADSVYTLAIKGGAKMEGDSLFQIVKLSEKQCDNLNIENGDMVTSVFAGSEADRAGIKEGDVILNLKEIGEAGGFTKFFGAKKELKIMRFTQDGSLINFKNVKIRMKGAK